MREIAMTTPALLKRMRQDLAWLEEDGYRESHAHIVSSAFDLRFDGPHAQVTVMVDAGRGEVLIWLRPLGKSERSELRAFLAARELPVPDPSLNVPTVELALGVVDTWANALKLLRKTELAGDWADLGPAHQLRLSAARQRREQLVDDIVGRLRSEPGTS